jgi:ribonuclease-3
MWRWLWKVIPLCRVWRWNQAKAPLPWRRRFCELERKLGYRFQQPGLLVAALKHRSYLDSSGENRADSNERLEFLGDAVLDLVVSEYFYHLRPLDEEGTLTNIKSTLVSGAVLVAQARLLDLGHFLLLSENEIHSGGRDRDSILEDALEAIIGAIYLDGGLKSARKFIRHALLEQADRILGQASLKNYKSMLLEYAQSLGQEQPFYSVLKEIGPDHDKRYTVEVALNGKVIGVGSGRSKKQAEQRAAAEGMKHIG